MSTRPILAIALAASATLAAAPYQPTLESLSKCNPAPDWFRDAKIGIYFHWGVYSVPAFGSEWYPRNMHRKGDRVNKHHLETWGDPTKFEYADFVPMFKAEKFDASEWADLFVQSGAKFAGPVCEHHDGFAMWDSEVTPWNAADMGPKRDITGELAKAIRARGMKFVATFHHARNSLWEKNGDGKWSGHYDGIKQNYPSLLDDKKNAILYGYMPREQFVAMWKDKLVEVIDRYQPDLIWFDSWLDEIPEQTRFEFAAYYLNAAEQWGREVVITRKQQDLPLGFSLEDFEKGRADNLTENVWLTDDTISKGSWCYTRDLTIKDPDEVIDTTIDLVSKNGQLLLNISPMADGTIPQDQRDCLLSLGKWLKTNGEAIYDTRPWLTYGEGPTRMKKGGHFVGHIKYGPNDIRYTRSKDGTTLYATVLGWPAGPLTLSCVKAAAPGTVTLLGHEGPVRSSVNESGQLVITPPGLTSAQRPGEHAFSFKITGADCSLHEAAALENSIGSILKAGNALLTGDSAGLEEKADGRQNIGYWDNASDQAHWLVETSKAGRYKVAAEYATVHDGATVRIAIDHTTLDANLPKTGGWSPPRWQSLGTIEIKKAGVHHLVLGSVPDKDWKAVNIWSLQLIPAP